MTKKDLALTFFQQGYSCSQAVLAPFAEDFGLSRELAFKVAGGFGGGMGRMAETCGAVTGAMMVLGLKFGAVQGNDRAGKEKACERVRELMRQFKARHQTFVCRELLGCDISTERGWARAREKNVHVTQCPQYVGDAAEIVERLITEPPVPGAAQAV